MRIFLLNLILFSCLPALLAGVPVIPRTTAVTVYRSGAKITSVATVRVPAGVSEVLFENLSPYFNGNSLQVAIKGNARLNTAVFRVKDPGPAPENPRARVIRDSLVSLGDVLAIKEEENKLLDDEAQMLQKNSGRVGIGATGQPNTLSVADLKDLANFYRQRLLEIRELQQKLKILQRDIKTAYERLQQELVQLQPNTSNKTGEIVLKIDAAGAQSLDITCTYLVSNAGWTPLYDLRSAGLDKALRLSYKANVRNSTGFDWKAVALSLSTAQPLANNNRPILNPVFVDFRVVAFSQEQDLNAYRGNIYQMKQIAAEEANLRGTRPDPSNIYIDGIRAGGDLDAVADMFTLPAVAEAEFITNFDLPDPQDIPADGKDNIVTVEEKEIPADYEYHAVPKVDPGVFLLAKVSNFGQYNLLPGTANIFFQETYVGQTWVNPQVTSDTLLLSLGRDEQLTIKRIQPKDFTERKKIFASRIKETYLFEISVKNNKPVPVAIDLLDQIPISKQKDITVELEDRGGAKYNAEFGKLEWKLEAPAGQTKKVRFSYSIEYPKDKNVGYSKS